MQYLQENMGDEVILLLADKYYMILSFWVCANRVTQSTQNNKFVISLQYLKENGKIEVDFLLSDRHQRFLQFDTIISGVFGQACRSYPK